MALYRGTGGSSISAKEGEYYVEEAKREVAKLSVIEPVQFSGDGSKTAYTLPSTPISATNVTVYISGVYQQNTSYTVSGDTLTFNAAPPSGTNNIEVRINNVRDVGTADASSVNYTPAGTGATQRDVQGKLRESVSVKDFGAKGDGVADDTAAIKAAITHADTLWVQLDLAGGTYKIDPAQLTDGKLTLPRAGLVGRGRITGATCRWVKVKSTVTEGSFECDNLEIDSVWHGNFGRIKANGDVTLFSSDPVWGFFWNTFQLIESTGKLIIDVDRGQSVNQNIFMSVRARGVHVKGVNTTGVRECHNNIFVALDSTGGDLTATDGSTGHQVINDSNLNQANTILSWYAETSGSRSIMGNWHVFGSNVDADKTPVKVSRNSHYLGAGGTGRNGDFFAGTPVNKMRGGEWKEFWGDGMPMGTGFGGGSKTIVSVTDAPDGNPLAVQFTATGTDNLIAFNYPLGSSSNVELTAFVQITNKDVETVAIGHTGGTDNFSNFTLTDVGNGWSLLRVSGTGSTLGNAQGATTGYVRIYVTRATLPNPAPVFTLGSFFLSLEQTAFLPQWRNGVKEAFNNAPPTGGTWAVGDRCWHTAPAAGGVPGWLCVTAGTPGTWKAMAALAA